MILSRVGKQLCLFVHDQTIYLLFPFCCRSSTIYHSMVGVIPENCPGMWCKRMFWPSFSMDYLLCTCHSMTRYNILGVSGKQCVKYRFNALLLQLSDYMGRWSFNHWQGVKHIFCSNVTVKIMIHVIYNTTPVCPIIFA